MNTLILLTLCGHIQQVIWFEEENAVYIHVETLKDPQSFKQFKEIIKDKKQYIIPLDKEGMCV